MPRTEAREYSDRDCAQFVVDMEEAGLDVFHYKGRWFWEGPAVQTRVDEGIDLQSVVRATPVKLQWEQLGKSDLVVYPVQSCVGVEIIGKRLTREPEPSYRE